MKWLLIIPGVIIGLILLAYLSGYLLPVTHTANYTFEVHGTPEQVWQRLTDIEKHPDWRKNVKSVTRISQTEWIEDTGNNKMPLKIKEAVPEHRLITEINDKNLPFGGHWVYELRPSRGETTVSLTENGEVYNPLFRLVSKFFMGYDTGVKQYGKYLQESFK